MTLSLFSLLSKTEENSNYQSKLKLSYDEFATKLKKKQEAETNPDQFYYDLSYIRLELVEIQNKLSGGKEKKCD